MMIDTEIRLSGEAANEFHNMMISADLNSIDVRDKFISKLTSEIDHQGVLSIDISDLNVDLSVLEEDCCEIEAVPVSKEETYIGTVNVQYLPWKNTNINILEESKPSYTVDEYYASESMHSVNQSVSIKYAA